MPPGLWERCGGAARIRRLEGKAWRVVEGQHVVSTRKLVDSNDEQETLERLIEAHKPRFPADPALQGLHYLLAQVGTTVLVLVWNFVASRRWAFYDRA